MVLRTDSDLDALCGKVRNRFIAGMEQTAKVTLLLDHTKPGSSAQSGRWEHREKPVIDVLFAEDLLGRPPDAPASGCGMMHT